MNCPKCGAENAADIDLCESCGSSLHQESPERSVAERRTISGTLAWIIAAALIVAFILMSQSLRPAGPAKTASLKAQVVETMRGDIVRIEGAPDVSGGMLADTRQDLVELTQATAVGDNQLILEMGANSQTFRVHSGTKARVIDEAQGLLRVQVLEGEYRGNSGWISQDYVRK